MIIYHNLSKLQSRFIKRYNNHGELIHWDGRLLKFKDFKKVIREILEEGQIGIVKKQLPLFKVYKKSFLKLFGLKNLKHIRLKEDVYKSVENEEQEKGWDKEIRLPEQAIAQGYLTPLQYELAHLFNGFHTIEEVANKMSLSIEEVYKTLKRIDQLGLLAYIEFI